MTLYVMLGFLIFLILLAGIYFLVYKFKGATVEKSQKEDESFYIRSISHFLRIFQMDFEIRKEELKVYKDSDLFAFNTWRKEFEKITELTLKLEKSNPKTWNDKFSKEIGVIEYILLNLTNNETK